MAHRGTESLNAVAAMVERFPGVKVNFGITGGSHQVAEITFGDKRRKVFFAQTPSDGNAHKQAARDALKALIELTTPRQ
jgi:hypothetical protein